MARCRAVVAHVPLQAHRMICIILLRAATGGEGIGGSRHASRASVALQPLDLVPSDGAYRVVRRRRQCRIAVQKDAGNLPGLGIDRRTALSLEPHGTDPDVVLLAAGATGADELPLAEAKG